MKTYIVVITYNGMRWLKRCLDSCKSYDVVIVDNASSDETVSFIEGNYQNVTLFKQDKNLGFGAANNIGISHALRLGAEHVFLLNQDAYLVNDVLEKLVSFQSQNPIYGIVSPIHTTGNKKRLDNNFSLYMLKEKTGQFYSDFVLSNKLPHVYEVPFVNAAAWLVSRECFERVGGFDPLFFHYGEDDNYCQRVLYHDYKIGVLPDCYIIHDRENRIKEKPQLFSTEYFKQVETRYKVRYANINTNENINHNIKFLRKFILKSILQFNLYKAIGIRKELNLLSKLSLKIEDSRKINKVIGPNYIEFYSDSDDSKAMETSKYD